MTKGGFAALNLFIKWLEYIPSTFDIHDSIFDIRFFYKFCRPKSHFRLNWPFLGQAAALPVLRSLEGEGGGTP